MADEAKPLAPPAWKRAMTLVLDALAAYSRHRADLLSAGLGFYAILSLAPLLLLAVAIASLVLGDGEARTHTLAAVRELLGGPATRTFADWLDAARGSSTMASVIGAVLFFFTASRLLVQLESCMNAIFDIPEAPTPTFKDVVRDFLKTKAKGLARFAALAVLFGIGVIAHGGVAIFARGVAEYAPGLAIAMRGVEVAVSFVMLAGVFTALFRFVPGIKVSVRDVLPGAAFTAALMLAGAAGLELYFGTIGGESAYGAAASVVVTMIWVLYTAQIFVFGAELSAVMVTRRFHRMKGEHVDALLPDAERAPEGEEVHEPLFTDRASEVVA